MFRSGKMRSVITVSLAAVTLIGCAARVEPMQTGDGRNGFSISCNGSAESWAKCYKAAAQSCPAGYDVIDRDTTATATGYGPLITRNLIVACKRA